MFTHLQKLTYINTKQNSMFQLQYLHAEFPSGHIQWTDHCHNVHSANVSPGRDATRFILWPKVYGPEFTIRIFPISARLSEWYVVILDVSSALHFFGSVVLCLCCLSFLYFYFFISIIDLYNVLISVQTKLYNFVY